MVYTAESRFGKKDRAKSERPGWNHSPRNYRWFQKGAEAPWLSSTSRLLSMGVQYGPWEAVITGAGKGGGGCGGGSGGGGVGVSKHEYKCKHCTLLLFVRFSYSTKMCI